MILLLKSDKTLMISKFTKILQQETGVDQFTFYIPDTYGDESLKDFTVTLYYTDPGNTVRQEILTQGESEKEGYLLYTLPVDTNITSIAGTIKMYLTLTYYDTTTSTPYVLHSSQLNIDILPWEDYYKFVPNEALSAVDNKLLAIDNEIEKLKTISDIYNTSKVDDLLLAEDGILHVSAGGTAIGDGVDLELNLDDTDGNHDGEEDLDIVGENDTDTITTSEIDLG